MVGLKSCRTYKDLPPLAQPHSHLCRRAPFAIPLLAHQTPQQAGELEKSRAAYERAAMSQDKIGSTWHAAKHLETASQISKDLGDWGQVAEYTRQAANSFGQAGRPQAGEMGGLLCRDKVSRAKGRCSAWRAPSGRQQAPGMCAEGPCIGHSTCMQEDQWLRPALLQGVISGGVGWPGRLLNTSDWHFCSTQCNHTRRHAQGAHICGTAHTVTPQGHARRHTGAGIHQNMRNACTPPLCSRGCLGAGC